eukprot:6198010-Pyramimonas_sp.AAC.2
MRIGFADETTRPAQAAAAPQLITVALNCGLGTLQYRSDMLAEQITRGFGAMATVGSAAMVGRPTAQSHRNSVCLRPPRQQLGHA